MHACVACMPELVPVCILCVCVCLCVSARFFGGLLCGRVCLCAVRAVPGGERNVRKKTQCT